MRGRWEVERDRFGVMFSGPLEVGECIEVMPVAEHRAEIAALSTYYAPLKTDCHVTDEMVRRAAEAIEDEAVRLLGRDLGTVHRDRIVRAGLEAALSSSFPPSSPAPGDDPPTSAPPLVGPTSKRPWITVDDVTVAEQSRPGAHAIRAQQPAQCRLPSCSEPAKAGLHGFCSWSHCDVFADLKAETDEASDV